MPAIPFAATVTSVDHLSLAEPPIGSVVTFGQEQWTRVPPHFPAHPIGTWVVVEGVATHSYSWIALLARIVLADVAWHVSAPSTPKDSS